MPLFGRKPIADDLSVDENDPKFAGRLFGNRLPLPPPSDMDGIDASQPVDQLGDDRRIADNLSADAPLPDAMGQSPEHHKRDWKGILSKIATVGLPAIFGMASGVGAIPGIMSGMASLGKQKRQGLLDEMAAKKLDLEQNYKNERNNNYKDKTANVARHQQWMEENYYPKMVDYSGVRANAAKTNAGANAMRASNETPLEKFSKIMGAASEGRYVSPEDMVFAKQYAKEKKKREAIGGGGGRDPSKLVEALENLK